MPSPPPLDFEGLIRNLGGNSASLFGNCGCTPAIWAHYCAQQTRRRCHQAEQHILHILHILHYRWKVLTEFESFWNTEPKALNDQLVKPLPLLWLRQSQLRLEIEGYRGLMVKASGWQSFDRQVESLPPRVGVAWDAVPEPMVELGDWPIQASCSRPVVRIWYSSAHLEFPMACFSWGWVTSGSASCCYSLKSIQRSTQGSKCAFVS